MAELKTQVNKASVEKYLRSIKEEQKREDCIAISNMMEKAAKTKPEMWGSTIVGFGRMKYTYANGKEGEWMKIGFAPRKQNIALYINKLADIDTKQLEVVIKLAVKRKK